MRFSIIVVSLNPGEKLRGTLESIRKQDFQDYEVIIKDGGSKDGAIEKIDDFLSDERYHLYCEKDSSIYDGMNQAVAHVNGEYLYFLNCGDSFYDKSVLSGVNQRIQDSRAAAMEAPCIFYGDIYGEKNQVLIPSFPSINGFACYRNVPCHQACFYDSRLCREKAFDLQYRIRADYEHFLWCFFVRQAKTVYTGTTIANYEGGGYSETKENLKRSKEEHGKITKNYIPKGELFRYKLLLLISLAPLRTRLAESPVFSKWYNAVKNFIYGRKKTVYR